MRKQALHINSKRSGEVDTAGFQMQAAFLSVLIQLMSHSKKGSI